MELRSQDHKEIGRSNLSYNPPNSRDQISPKLLSSPVLSDTGRSNHNQNAILITPPQPITLDHHPLQSNSGNPNIQTPTPITTRSDSGTTPVISTTSPPARYRECLKNHAASIGSYALDGCGEFMPCGDTPPETLKCAVCECHRNFHRKEIEGELASQSSLTQHYFNTYNNPKKSTTIHQASHFQHDRQISFSPVGTFGPMMMAFGGSNAGVPADSSSEDRDMRELGKKAAKKRFRTKFSEEQKEKMMGFAEKLNWKIQKHDEPEVQRFCNEVGVKRQVFKVWMHNKQALKKKQVKD